MSSFQWPPPANPCSRIPRSNYAQNTMVFDQLMNTFQEYKAPTPKEVEDDAVLKKHD